MRHPLNWILRAGVPESDRVAILGDLDEEYAHRVRPTRGWLQAQAWYVGELLAACACAMKDRVTSPQGRQGRQDSAASRLRRTFGGGRDVRNALRRWRHRPGFAVTAIVTLALGIGATTAIFSVVDAVLLTPPAWPNHDRLVAVHATFTDRRSNPAAATTWNRGAVTYSSWDALRLDPVFAAVGVWRAPRLDTTFGDARTDIVTTIDASADFLALLGARVIQGRSFNDAEDNRNSNSVLITHETWQRRLGGRADVIGLGVPLGSASSGGRYPKTIVGVIAPGFEFAATRPEFVLPVGISAETGRTYLSGGLRVIAAVAPGASIEAAETAARTIVGRIETGEPTSARVVSLAEDLYGNAKRPLTLLFGGAALLLLVACANVAGLLIGESRARRHEIAVRAALGSGRLRVLRQLAIEHALLALAGSAAGLAIAYWLVQLFVGTAPAGLPRIDEVQLDARAVLFAFTAGALTFVVFGIAPAFTLARTPAAAVLAEGGRDGASSRTLGQRLVVAAEIALALVLVVGASLLGETLYRAMSQPLGFDPARLAIVSFQMTELPGPRARLGPQGSQTPQEATRVRTQLEENMSIGWWQHLSAGLDRVAALPGVTTIGAASGAPFLPGRRTGSVRLPGDSETTGVSIRLEAVSDRYFPAMNIPILRGRNFENADRRVYRFLTRRGEPLPSQPALISETLERRLFNGSAVGQRLIAGTGPSTATYEILGVVPDARFQKDGSTELPVIYSFAQGYQSLRTLLVRTSGDPRALLPAIRDELRRFDPTIVVTSTTTMDELLATAVAEERFRALLAMLFGTTALVLAAVGLYGLAARRVADRRREIAVRVALGARPRDVRGLVLRDALQTVSIGLALGLPAAFLGSKVTEAFLFGVSSTSPHIFASAALVLAIAAFLATVLPARRAAAIDPMVVLKE